MALAGEPESPPRVLEAHLWGLPHPPTVGADRSALRGTVSGPGAWWGRVGLGLYPHVRGASSLLRPPEWPPALPRAVMYPSEIRVQLREQHLYYQDRLLPVNRVIMHPDYYIIGNGADIALLELEDPVNISPHVQLVTLPSVSETFPTGTPCWVTGWGDVKSGSEHQGQQEGWGEQGWVTSLTQPLGPPPGRVRVPSGPLRARVAFPPDVVCSPSPQRPSHRRSP